MQYCAMGSVRLQYIAILLLILCAAVSAHNGSGTRSCTRSKYSNIFVIGDSSVDNGNRDPNNSTYTPIGSVNQPWRQPFGRTRPGRPSGKFSDGKVISDFLAGYIGLAPAPYRLLKDSPPSTRLKDGLNFAVGGAGVFPNEGFTKSGDQIKQLKAVLNEGIYKKSYDKMLILYAISGNDYYAYTRNGGSSDPVSALKFITSVVDQITKELRMLYDMGFRNFIVPKLGPLGCLPIATATNGFKQCTTDGNTVTVVHNAQLVLSLKIALPFDANILFLNFESAIEAILFNPLKNFRLDPCCTGLQFGRLCGDVDAQGNKQYSLCSPSSQDDYYFWDEFHPTEASYSKLFDLFVGGIAYTDGRSLRRFLGCR